MSFLVSFKAPVVSVEHKQPLLRSERTRAIGPDGKPEVRELRQDLGWFIRLEGSWESIHVGMEKPDLQVGQMMHVTLRAEAPEPAPGVASGDTPKSGQ